MWSWVSYTISIIATPFKWCASFFAGNPPLAKPTADSTTQAFGTVFLGPFGPKKITKDASTQTCDLLGEHHESIKTAADVLVQHHETIQIASDAISNIF